MDSLKEDIQKLFSLILGSKVNTVEKKIDINEKDLFVFCVQQLELCLQKEMKIEELGMNLNPFTDPLWFVIENLCVAFYGGDVTDLIMWYLYDRKDEEEQVQYYIDDKEQRYLFNTPHDLWSYVKYNFL